MMDYIRQLQVAGRRSLTGYFSGGSPGPGARRSLRLPLDVEPLERRELLSTIQNFDGGGTSYVLQPIGGPPAPKVTIGTPVGNLLLATTPTTPSAGNDNSISFETSDPGTFSQVTADWDFRVTPPMANPNSKGVGMSFALLNTNNYMTSGGAFSPSPEQGNYEGSLAFGFDTTNDMVNLSLNAKNVAQFDLPSQFLASSLFIHAHAVVGFSAATVSLVLTPQLGSPVTVFNATPVTGLAPYESRVSFEAKNSASSVANFELENINVQYQPGIHFGSTTYQTYENQTSIQIDVVRNGGPAGSFFVSFTSADGTAHNGVNYTSVSSTLVFGIGVYSQTVMIPIIDDHLYDGNKTVNLYLSNTVNFLSTTPVLAPLGSPIKATLTILNTDLPSPTVTPPVQFLYAPHTRRVTAFRVYFSQTMDKKSAESLGNYEVLLPPAHKHGPVRVVTLSQAVLDPSGQFVTLTRADLGRQHLTKRVQIVVRGKPSTGLRGTNKGTFLAGAGGVSGTDAVLNVSV